MAFYGSLQRIPGILKLTEQFCWNLNILTTHIYTNYLINDLVDILKMYWMNCIVVYEL